MKQIVVAIDFSDASLNSVDHAVTIAQKAKSKLTLVWVNKESSSKAITENKDEDIESIAKEKFEKLKEKLKDKLPADRIKYVIRSGRVYSEVANLAREIKANLILVGTHGTSGYDPFWIGSNANKLISASPCPVITIRFGIDVNRPLKKIVMPIDDTMETRQKLPVTAEMAKYFDATIYILGLYPNSISDTINRVDNYVRQVADYLKSEKINCETKTTKGGNITKTTIDYATKIDANLIVIMTEQTKHTKNLWLGPYAQQMVNQSHIPVLSVHPKEFLRTVAGL